MSSTKPNDSGDDLDSVWDMLMTRLEQLPDDIILSYSAGQKSHLLLFMLLSSGVRFSVFTVDVENRHPVSVVDYRDRILGFMKNLGYVVEIIPIVCHGLVNGGLCTKRVAAQDYIDNYDGNTKILVALDNGFKRSYVSDRSENVLFPFYDIDDETLRELHQRHVPNVLRPTQLVGQQCNCPYGQEEPRG